MKLTPTEREAANKLRAWREDPALFCRENFGVSLEAWQLRGTEAYRGDGKRRICFQAAVGVGKSAIKAMLGWHFIACHGDQKKHPGKFPNGYALSISGDNLKSGLWKELGVWYARSAFLQREFIYTAEEVKHRAFPLTWWLRARSYSKSADPETQGNALSGLHSPWTIILLDEVGDQHPQIGRRAEQALSDAECEVGRILASGNPSSTIGLLYDIATAGTGWTVIRITGDPDDPDCSTRVDKEWAREQIARHSRLDPWVMAHILGQFPPGGINTLLSPDEVRTAMARNPRPEDYEWSQKRLGIDAARFGDDRWVIFPRQGLAAFRPVTMSKVRTDLVTARVIQVATRWGSELEFIDDTGHWGHGVVDNLIAVGRPAQPVIFSDPAQDGRYLNRRAEMWFRMADWVRDRGALPNMPELIPELTKVTYGFKSGKICLEDKDITKKLIGRSPDLADGLALTFALEDMPGLTGMTETSMADRIARETGALLVQDYDPFSEERMAR